MRDALRAIPGPLHGTAEPLHIRQVRPADATALAAFFNRLSVDTIYYRYFTASRPSLEVARRIARADHRTQHALIAACADGRVVGLIECYPSDNERAELGIVLDDAYQGHGLGSRLLRASIRHLRPAGVTELDGDILTANYRATRWIRKAGARSWFQGETTHFVLPLDGEAESLPRAA